MPRSGVVWFPIEWESPMSHVILHIVIRDSEVFSICDGTTLRMSHGTLRAG